MLPVRPDSRIGEQHTAYRRGLVLGLTMAEVGILVIFVLLLLLALAAFDRQQFADAVPVPTQRLVELTAAEQALHAITDAVGVEPADTPEEITELVRAVAESAQSADGQASLRAARQSRDLAIKEGQLKYTEERLRSLGRGGAGARPCWVEADGSVVFLYDAILTSGGIRMRLRNEVLGTPRLADLGAPVLDAAVTMSEDEFRSRTRALYDYGRRAENQCRFHVYVWDGTAAAEKERYKDLLRTVEGHFYKQTMVPSGVPF
jgi:hypothetical protein